MCDQCARHRSGDSSDDVELMERLADAEHASWSRWMDYLFSRSVARTLQHGSSLDPDDLVIPGELVRRWRRQAATNYVFLSDSEKESDRDEVRHILPLIRSRIAASRDHACCYVFPGLMGLLIAYGLVIGFGNALGLW